MLSETDRERIRRAFHLEKKSIRQLAKEEGCSRDTIRRALSHDIPKLYWLIYIKSVPVFGPYQLRADALLHQKVCSRKWCRMFVICGGWLAEP
jgi:hypothetical protein